MPTYTQLYYHIVFGTKHRKSCLKKDNRDELYKYIWGILNKKNCHLYRINGVEDHLHIFTHIHPSISLSNLVKDIKLAFSYWIKNNKIFPMFSGWQDGYAAFTKSDNDKDKVINYIKNQEEHHRKKSFKEELQVLLQEVGIEFNEKYLI